MVDADHGRHIVTHRAHGVVALVTMHGPVARFVGDEFDLAHLTDRDVLCHFRPAGRNRDRTAIRTGELKLDAMHMERVVRHS